MASVYDVTELSEYEVDMASACVYGSTNIHDQHARLPTPELHAFRLRDLGAPAVDEGLDRGRKGHYKLQSPFNPIEPIIGQMPGGTWQK